MYSSLVGARYACRKKLVPEAPAETGGRIGGGGRTFEAVNRKAQSLKLADGREDRSSTLSDKSTNLTNIP